MKGLPNRPGRLLHALWLVLLVGFLPSPMHGQSTEIGSPSPVTTNELVGTIPARDLGDARLTDHYFAFVGTPGDVLITIKSSNLNGDVDVFTAGSLKPLLKFTLYAEGSSPATKGIYLRRREDLILRVEARSPNDDEGSYQVRFGGSFEALAAPATGDEPASTASAAESTHAAKSGRRVSSVGARIYEPPPPAAVATATPAEPTSTPDDGAKPSASPAPSDDTVTAKPAPVRRGRDRGLVVRRNPPKPAKTIDPAAPENNREENAGQPAAPETAARPGRTGKRRAVREPAPAQDPAELQTGPRLVIEMVDGTRIERYMSSVRRVTVENNQIVVVRRDGRIERTSMTEVLRMAIEQ
ncbi:MAG: hypothetical protein ABI967_13065 [bacterium]